MQDLLGALHDVFHMLQMAVGGLHGIQRFAHGFQVTLDIGDLLTGIEHRANGGWPRGTRGIQIGTLGIRPLDGITVYRWDLHGGALV